MPLSSGDRLGPYEIVAFLGAGGMGEVYRASDARLGRDVALKILTEATAGNTERQVRFEREARAIAALNHPNIVSIYDIGSEGAAFYIVSELIDGESLRDRIQRGHISVRELLQIAVQIADGIAAAHSAGFVHRDLKPENIMLTSAGRVKILDFGLARQVLAAAAPDHTVTLANTLPGTILGTVNYMSPEQARGLDAGPQSDQFSLGVVLHELASGSRAFERDTTPQTLTAILVEEPTPLDPKLPAPLRWTIDRCLAKDPKARYASTHDLHHDLRNQLDHFSDLFHRSAEDLPAAAKIRRNWLHVAIPIACLAAGIVGALLLGPKPHGIENYKYTPIEITLENPGDAAWSPDGGAIAYSAQVDGKPQAFLRYLASPTPAQLTHDPDGVAVAGWFPDGKRIYIIGKNPQGDKPPRVLFSLSVTGGDPEFIMPLAIKLDDLSPNGVHDISRDGKVLAALTEEKDGTSSISISSPIGSPFKRYPSGPFESRQVINRPRIRISPDGSRLLYFASLNGRQQAWLLPLPAGSGAPKEVLTDLPKRGATPTFSWFPDGRRIAISLPPPSGWASYLWIVDTMSGRLTPLTTGVFHEADPVVSPNGGQILSRKQADSYVIISASLQDASVRRWMSSQRPLGMPAWSRKSERFVYVTNRNGEAEIWLHESDGSDRPVVAPAAFPPGPRLFMDPVLSPAEDRLAVYFRSGIWISSVAGGPPIRLTNAQGLERTGAWSPDGSRFVYNSLVDGRRSLMICKTSGQATPVELRSGVITVISDWSPTGEWITFRDRSGWNLISPDGKSTRALGKIDTPHLAFSRDGQTLYGIREEVDHQYLFSLTLDGRMKTIGDVGAEFAPRSYLTLDIRFSVAPDGKSVLYPTNSTKSSLWMLEGFEKP
jgi:Tol biopolymer transport system component